MTRYLYVGKTDLGCVWLLGRRIYVRRSWRRGDVHYLGTLGDLVGVVVRVKSLLGMRHVYDALVYVKRAFLRCLSLAIYPPSLSTCLSRRRAAAPLPG